MKDINSVSQENNVVNITKSNHADTSNTTIRRKKAKAVILIIVITVMVTAIAGCFTLKKVKEQNKLVITCQDVLPDETGQEKWHVSETATSNDFRVKMVLAYAREEAKTESVIYGAPYEIADNTVIIHLNKGIVHEYNGVHYQPKDDDYELFGNKYVEIVAEKDTLCFYEFGTFKKFQIKNAEEALVVRHDDQKVLIYAGEKILRYCDDTLTEVCTSVRNCKVQDGKILLQDFNGDLFFLEENDDEENPYIISPFFLEKTK